MHGHATFVRPFCPSNLRTAKTTGISKYLGSSNPDKITSLGINFSSRTSSLDVQIAIEVPRRDHPLRGAAARPAAAPEAPSPPPA